MAYFRKVGRAFGTDIKGYISVNLGRLEDDTPKQHLNLKFLDQEKTKRNWKRALCADTARNKCLK